MFNITQYHKEHSKRYYKEHSKERIAYHTEYCKNHKEELRKYIREYCSNRRRSNINVRISESLRARIYNTLKGFNKAKHTVELVGCSIEQLKEHLEKQFKQSMTWNNYGAWHIDHIVPCSKFDLSKSIEQRKCFNYKNLQPLWSYENQSKGNKI